MQSIGKANQRDYRGKGIVRMDLDHEPVRVDQNRELLVGSIHWEEVGRRMLLLKILGERHIVEQGCDARSNYPPGDGVGMPLHDEGRHLDE